jgi:hypothetical protein
VVLGGGRHQVEDLPQLGRDRRDRVQLVLRYAGLVALDLESEPLQQRVLGHLFARRRHLDGGRLGDRPAVQLDQSLEAGRGEVRQLVVMALDAHEGRLSRRKLDIGLEELLRDLVDRAVRWGSVRHQADTTARLSPEAGTVALCCQWNALVSSKGSWG